MTSFKAFLTITLWTLLTASSMKLTLCSIKRKRIAMTDNMYGNTPLHAAALYGDAEECRALLKEGADVNALNAEGKTPFMLAILRRKNECATMMLRDAKLHIQDSYRETVLQIATMKGNEALFHALLDSKQRVNVHAKSASGRTAFHFAAWNGNEVLCRNLVEEFNVDVHGGDDSGDNALHFAARSGNEAMCRALIEEFHLDPNRRDVFGDSALHFAARSGNDSVCRALLDGGADVNAPDNVGYTPLMIAILYENKECVKTMLRMNPKLEITNKEGRTALQVAQKTRNAEMIKILEFAAENGTEDAAERILKL